MMTRQKLAALIPRGMRTEVYQQQFDDLADQLETCLDMQAVLQILEGENHE